MKKTINIQWMHCKACEILIEQQCQNCNCSLQNVSFQSGRVTIEYDNETDLRQFSEAIEQLWYTTWAWSATTTQPQWSRLQKLLILLGIAVLFWFVRRSEFIHTLIPSYDSVTWSIALLVWLIASVSTCLAVTWWIVIGYTETVQDTSPRKTQLSFHLWRIIAFAVWWFMLWMLWNQFTHSVWFTIMINALVWIILLMLWLQLLWIVGPHGIPIHRPQRISNSVLHLKDPKYAPLVWAITFFLPCGFTQSMQLFALQSMSPLQWAIIMGMFALWTLPVLLGVWISTAHIKKHIKSFNPLIAWLLLLFGLYTVANAYWLYTAQQAQQIINTVGHDASIWTIEYVPFPVGHTWWSFEPSQIIVPVGAYYDIQVTPSANGRWCMRQLARWWSAIDILAWETFSLYIDWTQPWIIPLVCASMWMRQWEILIQ